MRAERRTACSLRKPTSRSRIAWPQQIVDTQTRAAMHSRAQIYQSLRSFDQRRQNVGREHIDSEDARNSRLRFHPPLAIANARIVDYGVEASELIDLLRNSSRPSDGGEVPGNNPSGAACRSKGVTTSALVSPVQDNVMALFDQEPGRHETEAVR